MATKAKQIPAEEKSGDCNCIEIIRGKLKERHHSEIDFDLKATIDLETGQFGCALPPLVYHYMDGKKRKTSHVHFNFCPFCGKKKHG